MTETLQHYIDLGLSYNFDQAPAIVRNNEAEALQNGVNCVSLAHMAINGLFNYVLPPEMHCYEMFSDAQYFATVPSMSDLREGDLVWFGWQNPRVALEAFAPVYDDTGMLLNWRDDPVTHVAIATGEQNDDGDPLLLHATHFEGANVVVWPLVRFATYPRYEKVYRISRLMLPQEVLI